MYAKWLKSKSSENIKLFVFELVKNITLQLKIKRSKLYAHIKIYICPHTNSNLYLYLYVFWHIKIQIYPHEKINVTK